MNTIPKNFPITVFEDSSEKISDTLTKKRVRIFYKGLNRNGSYISDEFAEQLISTLPYAPIKGIYDEEDGDYTNHGTSRSLGRIYGVVPENFNFAWEKHLDEDGVEREYACADVYLFTALYEEANDIDGKSQSMELYGPSIQGDWVEVNGNYAFKYSKASFLGLQVLGDSATPCFEGSAFFSLEDSQKIYALFTTLLEKIESLSIGGNDKMVNDTMEFVLSDNQKQNAIFDALNTEKVQYFVMDSYEDYAIVYNLEDDCIYKVNYTKNEDDTVSVAEEKERLFAEYVTQEEKDALNTLRTKTETNTFAAVVEAFDANIENAENMQTEIDNKEVELSTLRTENENLSQEKVNLENQVAEYTATIEDLSEYKLNIETAQKMAVIDKYSDNLSEEVVNSYKEKVADFTYEELEKELAFELVQGNPTIFTHEDGEGYVPQESVPTGLEALLSKYKKN